MNKIADRIALASVLGGILAGGAYMGYLMTLIGGGH